MDKTKLKLNEATLSDTHTAIVVAYTLIKYRDAINEINKDVPDEQKIKALKTFIESIEQKCTDFGLTKLKQLITTNQKINNLKRLYKYLQNFGINVLAPDARTKTKRCKVINTKPEFKQIPEYLTLVSS